MITRDYLLLYCHSVNSGDQPDIKGVYHVILICEEPRLTRNMTVSCGIFYIFGSYSKKLKESACGYVCTEVQLDRHLNQYVCSTIFVDVFMAIVHLTAIWNYDGNIKNGLRLMIGDNVVIREQCCGKLKT